MDLNGILSKLDGKNKTTVYMSVTPSVGLEMILFDVGARQVKNYAYRPLAYNESLREISDYESFKQSTSEMLDELGLPHNCNVVINLPLVLFGSKDIQLMVDNEGVTSIITSEVEQSYIFKRYEPTVSWVESNYHTSKETRKIFYTAVQQNAIDNIKTALAEVGATLVGVEVSISSIFRTLIHANLAVEQMKDGVSWNLMTVGQNGYSICSMMGRKVVDYYEEALAIKSFSGEEIYKAINASAQLTLMSYPANYLYIISETDDVSAEILANRLQVDGNIQTLENNKFKKQEIVPVSLDVLQDNVMKISLESVGVALSKTVPSPLQFNLLGGESSESAVTDDVARLKINGVEYEVSAQMATQLAIFADIPLIALAAVMFLLVPMYSKNLDSKLQALSSDLQSVQSQIDEIQNKNKQSGNFDIKGEIKKVLDTNRTKLMSYAAIGESVPKDLWITYYVAKDDGKIDIKGESTNVKDIYSFFRNMKDSLLNVQLRLHKLEMDTGSVEDAVVADINKPVNYKFEITNMSDGELAPPPLANNDSANASGEAGAAPEAPPEAPPESNPGISPLGGNSLIRFGNK